MRSFAAAVLLAPLALASCTEENVGPLAERRQPDSISISAADIELNDGDTLQVFANLLDQNDNVFSDLPEGVEIEWSTGDDDIVEVLSSGRLIAVAPGVTTVRAETEDGLFAVASVRVRQVATQLVVIDDTNNQDGLPNSPLPDSVALRVLDRHGNGVPDVEVRFRSVSGGGSASPAAVISDANGEVRVQWTLGPVVGDQQLQAHAPGAGTPIVIDATISQVVFGELGLPTTATVGGTISGPVVFSTDLFPVAIGAAHVVISWDPAKLQLDAGSVDGGDYARSVRWFDNATGELHVLSTDPAMLRGDFSVADIAFDVVGGAGTTTTIDIDVEQLVGVNFQDATAAGVASGLQVTIN